MLTRLTVNVYNNILVHTIPTRNFNKNILHADLRLENRITVQVW
jgi:hypothetical protein